MSLLKNLPEQSLWTRLFSSVQDNLPKPKQGVALNSLPFKFRWLLTYFRTVKGFQYLYEFSSILDVFSCSSYTMSASHFPKDVFHILQDLYVYSLGRVRRRLSFVLDGRGSLAHLFNWLTGHLLEPIKSQ